MSDRGAYDFFSEGKRLLDERRFLEAVETLEKAVRMEPEKASIREALARALYNSGRTKRAMEEFAATLDLGPADDYAHFGIALCHARLGNKAAAIGHLKIAIAMKPDAEPYREALGRLSG
ncbi:MAG TPA: tetratricopeptide repeat protein [Actinomycetota bacterium]|nr:tetratricopeptide repeat protein [Actinomycetota bacterium]